MTVFQSMIIKDEGIVYPSLCLELEDGSEIVLTYVQYFHVSPSSEIRVCRVNTDLGIQEEKTFTNVKWIQVLN